MKKLPLLPSLILSLSLILYLLLLPGCVEKKDSEIKPSDQKTDTLNLKTAQNIQDISFTFNYKLEKGKNFRYKLITSQIENIQIENKDTAIQNNVIQQETFLMNFHVDNFGSNKTADLTCSITSVKSEADANGTKYSFQTGQSKNEEELKIYARYEAFMGNPFSLRISQDGEIVEISRTEKILNKFISINRMQDTIKQETRELLKRDLIEAMLKPILSQIFREFPEDKMGKDSMWTISQPPMPLASLVMKNTNIFKITGIEITESDTTAVIEGEMKTEVTGQQRITNQGIQYFFEKPRTDASGKIYFSLTRGLIRNSKTSTLLENSYTAEGPSPEGTMKQTQRRRLENSIVVESL